ncbi:MAG: glycosyltransferase family protein [Candidatus Wildermuthbacteria bacterium]|nr:glycosyltransferase family protein [Candidatus Wildermuthbacteria bacterium]
MKLHIFVQARLGSARLPGKVLMKICGKSVFELVVERLRRVKEAEEIVLVTGPEEKNQALVNEAKRLGMRYFCGSEDNLLDRFYQAALKFGSEAVMRITADCPLVDADVLSQGIRIFQSGEYDIVSNVEKRTYPDGIVFELFSFDALKQSWEEQGGGSESVTKYLLEDRKFSGFNMEQKEDMSRIRLTLDYKEDFEVIERIYAALYKGGEYFGLNAVLEYLKEHPEILKLNQAFIKTDYGIRPQRKS